MLDIFSDQVKWFHYSSIPENIQSLDNGQHPDRGNCQQHRFREINDAETTHFRRVRESPQNVRRYFTPEPNRNRSIEEQYNRAVRVL